MKHPRDTNDPLIWRKWYDLPRWRKRSREHKRLNPLCVKCEAKGIIVAAEVSDHVTPHKGSWMAFIAGPLQSLCNNCHSGEKRQEELRGFTTNIGLDGWPEDPRHAVYQKVR